MNAEICRTNVDLHKANAGFNGDNGHAEALDIVLPC